MLKLTNYLLLLFVAIYGLSGCVNKQALVDREQQMQEEKKLKDKQLLLVDKVASLEADLQQWHKLQPDLERLVAIEGELRLLISQLNTLVNEAKIKQKTEIEKKAVKPNNSDKKKKFYAVQLVSVSNVNSIQSSWLKIKQKNSALLSQYQPLIEQVTIKNKVYSRIKVGKFSSKNKASQLCLQLKGSGCLVRAHTGLSWRMFKQQKGL